MTSPPTNLLSSVSIWVLLKTVTSFCLPTLPPPPLYTPHYPFSSSISKRNSQLLFLNSCLFTKALAPSFDPEGGACTVLVALDNNALDPMLTAVDISWTTSSSQAKKIESELNQRLCVFEDAAHKEQQRLLEEFQKSKTIYENRIKDLKEKVANSQTSNQSAFQEKIAELEAKKEEFNQKKEDFDLKKHPCTYSELLSNYYYNYMVFSL
ncbi:hypothetical protein GEMRC1_014028 [Eukaryota sp. GEM-RC1]